MAATATVLAGAAASQDQHVCATEEAFQPIVIQSDPKAIADQARGNGVEDAPEGDAAVARSRRTYHPFQLRKAATNYPNHDGLQREQPRFEFGQLQHCFATPTVRRQPRLPPL